VEVFSFIEIKPKWFFPLLKKSCSSIGFGVSDGRGGNASIGDAENS
jgi:hypothetical protein